MATMKEEKDALKQMLDAVMGGDSSAPAPAQPSQQQAPDQQAFAPQKVFNFDFDTEEEKLRKKAEETVKKIVGHIMNDEMASSPYVRDKIEQDVNVLADLYMQRAMNNVMQRSIVTTTSRGNTAPRQYEVFGQLSDKIQALDKQIMSTEQTFRKTYMDLKYEITEKMTEDVQPDSGKALPEAAPGNGIMSPRQLIAHAQEVHRARQKEKEAAESSSEASFEEIK